MPELIDREVTQLLLDTAIKQFGENTLQDRMTKNGLLAARRIVSKQPTIEPEVRHGRWIEVAKHRDENGTILTNYECSECFAMLKDSDSEQIKDERFCYNCGADMREGGADNG